jgi:hypothetical protein
MRKAFSGAALILAVFIASSAFAADPADVAFWSSVSHSTNPAEFRDYLNAFPRGAFAELAKIKLEELTGTGTPNAPTARPASAAPVSTVAATRDVWRAIDRIELDVDASNLGAGSNQRLIVVPANTPDAVKDPNAFAQSSLEISPELLHMTLPPGPVGNDQVRLLYIPQFGDRFVVAARAAVRVLPGAPGATTTGQLVFEARRLGAVAFEAKYRDQGMKLEGQFLRVEARTTFAGWDMAGEYQEPQKYVELYLGALGTPTDAEGAPGEVLCLMPIAGGMLTRIAALKPGDDVVVTGTPTSWESYFGTSSVLFDRCQFAN